MSYELGINKFSARWMPWIRIKNNNDKKICYQEGKRATPTWLLSIDIAGVDITMKIDKLLYFQPTLYLSLGSETCQNASIWTVLGPFSGKPTTFFAAVHDHRWDIESTTLSQKQKHLKQWKYADCSPIKKLKVMASVFWYTKGKLLIDYLPPDQTFWRSL